MSQQRRRSRLILGLLALGLLAGAALTGSPAQAVDAVGPYYALPSWDKKMIAANRFVVLTNWFSQAVLDKETGLVWEKATASELRAWGPDDLSTNARLACAVRNVGGRKGWRLPSVHELQSLIDPTRNPALPPGHPFTVDLSGNSSYWSVTKTQNVAFGGYTAWGVNFVSGAVFEADRNFSTFHVWCVRGGNTAAQY